MEINTSAYLSGLAGMQQGQQRADRAASEIANLNTSQANSASLTSSLVELQQARQVVEASAKVVETADDVLGTLINTRV